jgi:hypothetical protein
LTRLLFIPAGAFTTSTAARFGMGSPCALTYLKIFSAALAHLESIFLGHSSCELKPHSGEKICWLEDNPLMVIRFACSAQHIATLATVYRIVLRLLRSTHSMLRHPFQGSPCVHVSAAASFVHVVEK